MKSDNTRRTRYNYESTARDFDVRTAIEEAPRRQLSVAARKNRDKAVHMNFGYVLFLTAALCLAAFILVKYIALQSQITSAAKEISSMESEYRSLKMQNDETYDRIIDSVNLTDVKKVAMEELGMVYAQEDQIVTYESNESDYVRQYSQIP